MPSTSISCWALLVAPLLAGGCVTSRGLTPRSGARLEARGSGVTARVKRVHLKWGNYKDQGPDQVVITVRNGSGHKVRLKPRRIRLVELRPSVADEVPRQGQGPWVPRVNPGAMAVQSGVAGAQLGGSLSGGGTGLGRVAGGVGGGMLGAAAAVAIMIPVGGYLLVDHLIRMTDRTIAPGKERALRISLGNVALDARERYALDLGPALEPPAPQMAPLPLVDVTDAHLGYDPPSTLRWIWLMRMGGGAIWEDAVDDLVQAIIAGAPAGASVSRRFAGFPGRSHDHFDAMRAVTLDLTLPQAASIGAVRDALVGLLLGRPPGDLSGLPASKSGSSAELVVRFTVVKRVMFKQDAQGNRLDADGNRVTDSGKPPVDSGDTSQWHLVIIGAVVARSNYCPPVHHADVVVEDLADGTALARAAATVVDTCDVGIMTQVPTADIIWVVDESTNDNVVTNANDLVSRALAGHLDVRMGVTGTCGPDGSACPLGKLCSKISTDPSDDGGVDRFLLPSEQFIFSSCIKNPPGTAKGYGLLNARQAVLGHLPRTAGDPVRIRPDATLVVIVATETIPGTLHDLIPATDFGACTLAAADRATVDQVLQPHLDLFRGLTDPGVTATLHVIGGVCGGACAIVAHGYRELARELGGQVGDICQPDQGDTTQAIVDGVVAASAPFKLKYVPISASLAVVLNGTEIQRSRTQGFDYRASVNAIVLVNLPYKKGSEVVIAGKRWKPGA